jgi:AraC family transcriptional regulator, transcriptional activator FtrA
VSELRARILVLPDVVPLDVSAAAQFFGADLPLAGVPCHVAVCGAAAGVVPTRAGFGLHVGAGVEALRDAGLILVAGTLPADQDVDPAVLDALRAAHARGVPIVAAGTAAFVLARAGLLDGRRATTHWSHAGELARRYPRIIVDPDASAVEDGRIATSTGLPAAMDLCLRVVRRAGGPSPERPLAERSRGLTEVRQWMVRHLDECTNIDDLAHRAYMSRRQFTRQFRAEVGASPWQWLIGQRLVQARHLLEETDEQIEAISRRCGFPTALAFRTTFKQSVGASPSEFRRSRQAGNHVAV